MGNSCEFFRFKDGYQDVFSVGDGRFTFAEAEPYEWPHMLACRDYDVDECGNVSVCGPWYGMTTSKLQAMSPADVQDAARVMLRECMDYLLENYPQGMEYEDTGDPDDAREWDEYELKEWAEMILSTDTALCPYLA